MVYDLSYCVYIPASMSHGMGQVEIKFFYEMRSKNAKWLLTTNH